MIWYHWYDEDFKNNKAPEWNRYIYEFLYYTYYYKMNDKISSEQLNSVNGLKDQIEFTGNIWHEN